MFFWKPAIAVAVLFFSLAVVQAQSNPARSEIVFPLFVRTVPTPSSGCQCWKTTFEVLNPNSSATTVEFTVFDSAAAVRGTLSDVILANRTSQRYFASFPTSNGNIVGWVRIIASQPVIVQQTITHFFDILNPSIPFVTEPLSIIVKTPPLPTRREVVKVEYKESNGTNTGVAIAFPAQTGSPAVRARLVLRWVDARVVAERELTIPANGQIMAFVTELLPEALSFSTFNLIGGTLEMTFDRDVFVTAIQYTPPLRPYYVPERMEEPLAGTVPFLIPAP